MAQSKAQPANTAAPAPGDVTAPTLAERLHPFMIDADPPANGGHVGGTTYNLRPSAVAVLLADLAARFAEMGDAALPDDMALSLSLSFQPWRTGYDRKATEAENCAVVAAVADAVSPGAEPHRRLMSDGTVHYAGNAVTAAGLAVGALTSVEPREGELPAADVDEAAS